MYGTDGPHPETSRAPRHLALAQHHAYSAGADPTSADPAPTVVVQLRETGLMHVLDDVEWRVDTLLEQGPRAVVVDMSQVGQLSSTSIAALLWIMRRCSARGVKVVLRQTSRRSAATLERMGLGRLDVETAGVTSSVRRS